MNKRIIPTIPYDAFVNGTDREKYKKVIYNSILEAIEQGIKSKRNSLVIGKIDNKQENTSLDITLTRDTWKTNLGTVLEYYEQNEEYEKCERAFKLINKMQ